MGQIFNRVKRLVRANIGALADKVTNKLLENDFLRKRWEEGNKFREEASEKFEEGQEYVREKWEDFTSSVPTSLTRSYELLGVPFGAPMDLVRKEWKKKIEENHPDRFDPKERDAATKRAARINEAYQKIEKYWREQK